MAHMQVIKEKMTMPLQDSRFLALELRKTATHTGPGQIGTTQYATGR